MQAASFTAARALAGRPVIVGRKTTPTAAKPAVVTVTAEYCTGVKRNANIGKLQAGYLFPEIARRRKEHLEKNPGAKIISLGIGDTTEPLPEPIWKGMAAAAEGLGNEAGYSGYGAEAGQGALREAICNTFYKGMGITPDEVFVSDGSKCDISRLQAMFGPELKVAVQDPAYPAYVDTSVMTGMTGMYNRTTQQFDDIVYLKCSPENDFFPDLEASDKADVVFFCSPNNPTGAAATKEQLTKLVAWAKERGTMIVYDTAYSVYITDPNCPKSIFEIPGAKEVALETCSFSKSAGFTGVRLGWTVVPNALKYSDGHPVRTDWNRVMSTCFNGASNVVQAGGLACCSDAGMAGMAEMVGFYKENAKMLKKCFDDLGYTTYGGENAPYVWVSMDGKPSWDAFAEILEKTDIVTTPGAGFGVAGDGFIRISAFGHRENVVEAIARFQKAFAK